VNLYAPIQTLEKSPVDTGGACSIRFIKWEDVEQWPVKNPLTGIVAASLTLKPGKSIYFCKAQDKGRSYSEESKNDSSGPFVDMEVTGTLAGSNSANALSFDAMKLHRWVVIFTDRNGVTRIIGNKDSGARFNFKYDSGDVSVSRKAQVRWTWSHAHGADLYGGQAFNISVGGNTITAGSLTLIMRFRVGAAGAPMTEASTTLTNAGFANKNLLVIAGGFALPVNDGSGDIDFTGSIERHYEKTFAGDTLNFIGGVADKEIIEIYAFS